MDPAPSDRDIRRLLAVVRLGDTDHFGWWRSRSLDDVAEYALGQAFPETWKAAGVELALESARIRHEGALPRASAVHLFSDRLPFVHSLRTWLVTKKYERDDAELERLRTASRDELVADLGLQPKVERRGAGLFLGELPAAELEDSARVDQVLNDFVGSYLALAVDFAAPYFDLT